MARQALAELAAESSARQLAVRGAAPSGAAALKPPGGLKKSGALSAKGMPSEPARERANVPPPPQPLLSPWPDSLAESRAKPVRKRTHTHAALAEQGNRPVAVGGYRTNPLLLSLGGCCVGAHAVHAAADVVRARRFVLPTLSLCSLW